MKELLRDYQPTSSERKPFWCRVCYFQGNNEDELKLHRTTELHLAATEKERKLSYCSICKKQFTSPDQLKAHLQGKQHMLRLERIKSSQVRSKKYC